MSRDIKNSELLEFLITPNQTPYGVIQIRLIGGRGKYGANGG
jgi:hypothetical protein